METIDNDKIRKELIVDFESLQARLEICVTKDSIIKRDEWNGWAIGKGYTGKGKGISYQSIRNLIYALGSKQDLEKNIKKAKNLLPFLEDAVTEKEIEIKNKPTLEEVNKSWFLYHFYNSDPLDDEPALARAVLNISGKQKAELINVQLGQNYIGEYHIAENKTLFFNLNVGDKKSAISSTHIRVYYSSFEDDQIMIGSYITYERDRIVRGSVVLEEIHPSAINPVPKILSYKTNKKEYSEVKAPIKQYLSLKYLNHRSSFKDIYNIDRLELHVQKQTYPKWNSRFFEPDTPRAFISTPFNSIKEDKKNHVDFIKALTSELNIRLNPDKEEPRIELFYKELLNLQNKQPHTITSLFPLKRTRFFIGIFPKTDMNSFSLVELGWALSFVKKAVVVYEEGAISKRIETLEKMGVKLICVDNIKKNVDMIVDKITEVIEDNLFNLKKT